MAEDAGNLYTAQKGSLYVAALTVAEPASEAAALDPGWIHVGLVTPDGVTFRDQATREKVKSWGFFGAKRTITTDKEPQVTFALQEFNSNSIPLAFGGGAITEPSPGHFKYSPPEAGDAVDEKKILVHSEDGDKVYRWVFPKCSLADAVETSLVSTAISILPLTFDVLVPDSGLPWYWLSNDLGS